MTPLPPIPDHYAALGVARDAEDSVIKKAWRKLAAELHPDVVEGALAGQELTDEAREAKKAAATARFKPIRAAWGALGDPTERVLYDAEVAAAARRKVDLDAAMARAAGQARARAQAAQQQAWAAQQQETAAQAARRRAENTARMAAQGELDRRLRREARERQERAETEARAKADRERQAAAIARAREAAGRDTRDARDPFGAADWLENLFTRARERGAARGEARAQARAAANASWAWAPPPPPPPPQPQAQSQAPRTRPTRPARPAPPPPASANTPMTGVQAAKMTERERAWTDARAVHSDLWTPNEWADAVHQQSRRMTEQATATRLRTAADFAAARLRSSIPDE